MSTTYIDYDTVVAINAAHGGGSSVVRDEAGLRGAIGRPLHTFMGQDLYGSIWAKAGALLHALSSTQFFSDGNKRTAWITTKLFLALNAEHLRDTPAVQQEAFVRAVALSTFDSDNDPDATVSAAAEWFESVRVTAADRVGLATLAQAIWTDEMDNALFVLGNAPLVHMMCPPGAQIDFAFLLQVRWKRHDLGEQHLLELTLESERDGLIPFESAPIVDGEELPGDYDWHYSMPMFYSPFASESPLHGGAQPSINVRALRIHPPRDDRIWVTATLNGELLARLPLTITTANDVDVSSITGPSVSAP